MGIAFSLISMTSSQPSQSVHRMLGQMYRMEQMMKPMPTQNIAELAINTPQLSTLLAAVQAAGLAETLSGEGPFTVFAPTNAAFEKLPAGTVEDLLRPENKDKLVKILTCH